MVWKVKRRGRYALLEADEANPRVNRGTFNMGPVHVKHHVTKEFVEHAFVENPDFASERNCRVFVQSSNIAVEVYDFYNKLFDPDYEKVCVYDERFEVQYLFRETPKEIWRSVDYYNPRIEVIPLVDGVDVKKTFDTDYGLETLEITYTVRKRSRLKHNIVFSNETTEKRTFRVVMKLSGITSDKVKHGEIEERITGKKSIVVPTVFFGEDVQHLKLSEYLWSLGEVDEETDEWYPTTLRDIVLDVHARGCKADIIIGNYILAENESLVIDPSSDTWEVSAQTDDCTYWMEWDGGTNWKTNQTTNYVGHPTAARYRVGGGFRFLNIAIPNAAIIDSAYFKPFSYEANANVVVSSKVRGEDVDSAVTFSTSANFLGRARCSAVVSWSNMSAWAQDVRYSSPDIKTIIKEIVDRGGWSSGNDLVIFWDDYDDESDHENAHSRRAYAYAYPAAYNFQLTVTWHVAPIAWTVTLTESLGLVDVISKKHGHAFFLVLSEVLGLVDTLTGRVCVTWSRFRTFVAGLIRRLHSRV